MFDGLVFHQHFSFLRPFRLRLDGYGETSTLGWGRRKEECVKSLSSCLQVRAGITHGLHLRAGPFAPVDKVIPQGVHRMIARLRLDRLVDVFTVDAPQLVTFKRLDQLFALARDLQSRRAVRGFQGRADQVDAVADLPAPGRRVITTWDLVFFKDLDVAVAGLVVAVAPRRVAIGRLDPSVAVHLGDAVGDLVRCLLPGP